MQSEANQCWPQFNWGVSTVFSTAHAYHERVASIACSHDFSGPALLSCSKILTYQVLGSQLWTALPSEKSRSPATANKVSKSRHNSRTKLCIEISLVHIRDNIDFYLHCKFQSSPFSVRRKNGVTDRQNDRQRDYGLQCSMPRGSAHRGIMNERQTTRLLYCMPRGSAHRGITRFITPKLKKLSSRQNLLWFYKKIQQRACLLSCLLLSAVPWVAVERHFLWSVVHYEAMLQCILGERVDLDSSWDTTL